MVIEKQNSEIESTETVETVETAETHETDETVETVETNETAETVETTESEQPKKKRGRKSVENKTAENFFSDFKEDADIEKTAEKKPTKNKKYSNGKALLTIINVVAPIILSLITKQSPDVLKFSDDELKLLEPSADDFCIENKIEINGSITFFVLVGSLMYAKCDFSRFKKKKPEILETEQN